MKAMNKCVRYVVLLVVLYVYTINAYGQILDPVDWHFVSEQVKGTNEYRLILRAEIDPKWHIYGQHIASRGPVPTSFHFEASDEYELIGEVQEESKEISGFEKTFEMNISWFEDEAVFSQRIKAHQPDFKVAGYVTFMVCNDMQCLPPTDEHFEIEIHTSKQPRAKQPAAQKGENTTKVSTQSKAAKVEQKEPSIADSMKETVAVQENKDGADVSEKSDSMVLSHDTARVEKERPSEIEAKAEATESKKSLWAIWIAGLLGGFAAILMPCIFPMLPLTVSYFTKQNSKGSAVGKALFYGVSIILIYVVLGLLITLIFGANALNALSTNGVFNMVFFIILVAFAASFFGAFEITLPSGWGNVMDRKSDKSGVIGLFFMAATLALVSFSCTGPIIGTLLVQAATMGDVLGPAVGMFGFALSLSIPFVLFALFPSWMNALPRSGGWLNSVKVVLGFLELALSLKFISSVDLAYHWNFFDREVFLVLWIAIFGLMGLYLIGKLKFAHDSALTHISFTRLFLAIVVFGFTFYLIPGLWGAPLKAVSPFLPPQYTQDFDLYTNSIGISGGLHDNGIPDKRKYSDIFHAPLHLKPFFDYDEGLAFAQKVNKPVLIDFTGHACVNCRKMEATVWPDDKVLNMIQDDYILIQLYVDDKTNLEDSEVYTSAYSGKKIKTIGDKWSDLQAGRFKANSQPFYVLLSPNGELLKKPVGAVYDVEQYADFLSSGLSANKRMSK